MTDDQVPKAQRRAVALHFDSAPMKLAGWAAHEATGHGDDEILVLLMAGDVMLGRLRRDRERPDVDAHLGRKQSPCGFTVPDYGLRAFAELSGLRDLALVVDSKTVAPTRHALPDMHRSEIAVAPLGSRTGVRDSLRLGDLWLGSTRDLNLRFDGAAQVARSIDSYQCATGSQDRLVKVASNQPIGGFVSIASMKLLNPYLPVLVIFKGEDGAIDAIDLIPFPSLVRGGLHAAERMIVGDGGDDVQDTAAVSAELLRALLLRDDDHLNDCLATVVLDEHVHTGLEPMLNQDLLAWITAFLGIAVTVAKPQDGVVPDFIADVIGRFARPEPRPGHLLHVPADSIPTISALVRPLPEGIAAQKVVGAMGVVDGDRHGRISSVWQPSLGAWLDGLQSTGHRHVAPMLEVMGSGADGRGPLTLSWPLSLALRDLPTRIVLDSPFELSSELPAPLLRSGATLDAVQLCVIILCQRNNQPISPLLESLFRQEGIASIDIILVAPPGKIHADVAHFLTSRLADHHAIERQPFGRGTLEQVIAVRHHIVHDHVLIVDGDTILPDRRTLGSLVPMLDAPNVGTVGCMIRTGQGKSAARNAGYAPTGMNLRAIPNLSFAPVDPDVFRQPATFPVVANSMVAMVTKRDTIQRLDPRGSTALRPEVDDILFGMQVIEQGCLNLCSSIVSAYSNKAPVRKTDVGVSVPFRLSPEALAHLAASSVIIQSVR